MNSIKRYRYKIHVEEIGQPLPGGTARQEAITFEIANHDDILAIVGRVRAGTAFAPDDASALTLGLKLFSGVMLRHRNDPMFADIQHAMRVFTGNLKSRIASTAE